MNIAELKRVGADRKFQAALNTERAVTDFQFLAQGEYNQNYTFLHPDTGERLVLRINYGSQMQLSRQLAYEFEALRGLEHSTRTPKPIYIDESRRVLPRDFLVMSFIEGEHLRYEDEQLREAGEIFVDIHSQPTAQCPGIRRVDNVAESMLCESAALADTFIRDTAGTPAAKALLREIVETAREKSGRLGRSDLSTWVNTEVNNTNFLMRRDNDGGLRGSLVDWEKPLISDPAQDIGHFLAPTTSFWKTELILDEAQCEAFIVRYVRALKERYLAPGESAAQEAKLRAYRDFSADALAERCRFMIAFTCLRGLSWCASASVQYRSEHYEGLTNESTARKLKAYMEAAYMELVRERLRGL